MKIGTANYVITRQIQHFNIPFKYQVNLPWNTPVGLPKAFQRKTNWKYWIKYIKPIWFDEDAILNDITTAADFRDSARKVRTLATEKSAAVVISFNMASSSSNDNSYRLWTSSKLVKRLRLNSSDMFTSTKSLFPVKFIKSFPVRCSLRTNPSKVRSKHRTADLCPTCIKFPYVNINTAGTHSPLRPPSCQGTTPRGPSPQTHRPTKSKMTDPVPLSVNTNVHTLKTHKVKNITYRFKCLPGRSQACNPRPPQLPCTESQPADTALPGLTKQWDTYHV